METNIEQVISKISCLRYELVEYIEKMPDNPEIKPVCDKPKCCIIKQSVFRKHDNWLPRYHIIGCQKEMLIELVQTTPIEKLEERLSYIIDKGKMPSGKDKGERLHPIAINHLKKLLED